MLRVYSLFSLLNVLYIYRCRNRNARQMWSKEIHQRSPSPIILVLRRIEASLILLSGLGMLRYFPHIYIYLTRLQHIYIYIYIIGTCNWSYTLICYICSLPFSSNGYWREELTSNLEMESHLRLAYYIYIYIYSLYISLLKSLTTEASLQIKF